MFETVCRRLTLASSTKLIQLMESLYSHTATTLVQTPYNNFYLSMGVGQGLPVSSTFFNLLMDLHFLKKCANGCIKFLQLNTE